MSSQEFRSFGVVGVTQVFPTKYPKPPVVSGICVLNHEFVSVLGPQDFAIDDYRVESPEPQVIQLFDCALWILTLWFSVSGVGAQQQKSLMLIVIVLLLSPNCTASKTDVVPLEIVIFRVTRELKDGFTFSTFVADSDVAHIG